MREADRVRGHARRSRPDPDDLADRLVDGKQSPHFLLDPEEYPALDLACAYPLRWGCETVIGHHKTDMGEGQPVLRSGDPEGVMQEMWALFAVYQAICKIVGIAVNAAGIPPDKISFPHALAAATATVAAFPP